MVVYRSNLLKESGPGTRGPGHGGSFKLFFWFPPSPSPLTPHSERSERPHPSQQAQRAASRGFTLLELLIAIAIFAVMAAIAYGGLTGVLDARRQTGQVAGRLAQLQLTVSLMSRDLQQSVPRQARDSYGEPMPALMGTRRRVEVTRAGYANPIGLKRSALQRVAWSLEAGELVRWSWQVLDRARDSAPRRRDMLQEVDALRLRYFMQGTWFETWPPRSQARLPALMWPEAVEFTLVLDDWGTVTRLIPLVEAP